MPTKRKMIHVYVTEEEKADIETLAKRKGTSVSKLLLGLANHACSVKEGQPRVTVSKPDRGDPVEVPVPDDGVERGFPEHPSRKAGVPSDQGS